MTATDVLLYRTLASARQEGLPEPLSATTYSKRQDLRLHIHLDSAEDAKEWLDWLTRHGTIGWSSTTEIGEPPYAHHFTRGEWRGWRVELVYLTPVRLEAGVAGD